MEQFIGYKAVRPALDILELRGKYQELLERKKDSKLGKEINDISLKIAKLEKELKKINRKIAKTKKIFAY